MGRKSGGGWLGVCAGLSRMRCCSDIQAPGVQEVLGGRVVWVEAVCSRGLGMVELKATRQDEMAQGVGADGKHGV